MTNVEIEPAQDDLCFIPLMMLRSASCVGLQVLVGIVPNEAFATLIVDDPPVSNDQTSGRAEKT